MGKQGKRKVKKSTKKIEIEELTKHFREETGFNFDRSKPEEFWIDFFKTLEIIINGTNKDNEDFTKTFVLLENLINSNDRVCNFLINYKPDLDKQAQQKESIESRFMIYLCAHYSFDNKLIDNNNLAKIANSLSSNFGQFYNLIELLKKEKTLFKGKDAMSLRINLFNLRNASEIEQNKIIEDLLREDKNDNHKVKKDALIHLIENAKSPVDVAISQFLKEYLKREYQFDFDLYQKYKYQNILKELRKTYDYELNTEEPTKFWHEYFNIITNLSESLFYILDEDINQTLSSLEKVFNYVNNKNLPPYQFLINLNEDNTKSAENSLQEAYNNAFEALTEIDNLDSNNLKNCLATIKNLYHGFIANNTINDKNLFETILQELNPSSNFVFDTNKPSEFWHQFFNEFIDVVIESKNKDFIEAKLEIIKNFLTQEPSYHKLLKASNSEEVNKLKMYYGYLKDYNEAQKVTGILPDIIKFLENFETLNNFSNKQLKEFSFFTNNASNFQEEEKNEFLTAYLQAWNLNSKDESALKKQLNRELKNGNKTRQTFARLLIDFLKNLKKNGNNKEHVGKKDDLNQLPKKPPTEFKKNLATKFREILNRLNKIYLATQDLDLKEVSNLMTDNFLKDLDFYEKIVGTESSLSNGNNDLISKYLDPLIGLSKIKNWESICAAITKKSDTLHTFFEINSDEDYFIDEKTYENLVTVTELEIISKTEEAENEHIKYTDYKKFIKLCSDILENNGIRKDDKNAITNFLNQNNEKPDPLGFEDLHEKINEYITQYLRYLDAEKAKEELLKEEAEKPQEKQKTKKGEQKKKEPTIAINDVATKNNKTDNKEKPVKIQTTDHCVSNFVLHYSDKKEKAENIDSIIQEYANRNDFKEVLNSSAKELAVKREPFFHQFLKDLLKNKTTSKKVPPILSKLTDYFLKQKEEASFKVCIVEITTFFEKEAKEEVLKNIATDILFSNREDFLCTLFEGIKGDESEQFIKIFVGELQKKSPIPAQKEAPKDPNFAHKNPTNLDAIETPKEENERLQLENKKLKKENEELTKENDKLIEDANKVNLASVNSKQEVNVLQKELASAIQKINQLENQEVKNELEKETSIQKLKEKISCLEKLLNNAREANKTLASTAVSYNEELGRIPQTKPTSTDDSYGNPQNSKEGDINEKEADRVKHAFKRRQSI